MAMDPMSEDIPLASMIQALRRELQASEGTAEKEGLRFKVEGVELELQVAVSREAGGQGGIKFWVVNLEGKYAQTRQDVHTFKLKLLPVSGPQRGDVLVGDTSKEKGR